ncbi:MULTISPECIES: precorrin-6A synthase (deacetylating) [unclassified Nocardioides]|uniref:precorrin-6A synthase (deacetylating) n=1 Tax=unclassified Nocardioides TaxID=2615069 RepID=UPI0007010148|nr:MULTISPECIES: precorrin-6A synthase (deacetylating) [unclassified Nocardioides]KQY56363.1 precorrin 6A synthase [Nocardioides sp. Root140]KQZ75148.1 precorrin 6A synthase [Nocardioides sp. Root151]KRF14226.1 precorrin 6A synthase [Nocardioides sp. Soil796]
MTRRVRLVGIGSGHPDQLTLAAAAAIEGVDFVIAAAKSAEDPLLESRREICRRHGNPELVPVPDPPRDRNDPADYTGAVGDWHDARAAAYEKVLLERDGDAAFLVWGDPAFYDSTIRIVERILARGNVTFDYDVLPGISSLQVLAAAHRIVLHEVGQPILVTTGRRLAEAVDQGHDNLVVMLDGSLSCTTLKDQPGWHIWWGANLGTPDQALVAGPLVDVLPEIEAARAHAKATSGWVMDTYLLRRS